MMPAGARVVAAVSGGADSVALVHLLRELESSGCCRLVGIAHLNHRLRGSAADQDEAFCRDLAGRASVPYDSEAVDLRALAASSHRSIEAEGHVVRHAFLERAAARLGAHYVALGHTRDDQAETVLLRLIRGAGARGLAGMYPRTGIFVRPLLECSRDEVRRFIAEHGIPFREDASNDDLTVPRNRVRHRVIPALVQVSAGAVQALARAAAISQADADLLDQLTADARARLVRIQPDGSMRLDAAELRGEPLALGRRVVASVLREQRSRPVGFRHIEAVLSLGTRTSVVTGHLDLPGQTVTREGDTLVVRRRRPAEPHAGHSPGTNSFRFSLSIPGEVVSPSGWTVTAECAAAEVGQTVVAASSPTRAVLDAATLRMPLAVRGWRRGDRFRPLGLHGTKKLQDFFVDRKVPRATRQTAPLVVDADERVVWVGGHAIAEDFRVTSATCDVVILKLEYWRNGK